MKLLKNILYSIQNRWNEPLYWKMRMYCQSHHNFIQLVFIFFLRRTENSMNCSTGLGLNTKDSPMCIIESPLNTFHRLNNIIIGRNCRIGSNVRILHNVTISEADTSKMTIIEDDVLIGAGAIILNNAHIGRGAKIGANCVVLSDVPDGGVCVGNPGRVVKIIK